LLVSENFTAARALADSLLESATGNDPAEADVLKPLAALTGHVRRTLQLLTSEAPTIRFRAKDGQLIKPPLPVSEAGRAMLAYVSFGAPADSIVASMQTVERAIGSYVPAGNRRVVRDAVLSIPLTLVYPVLAKLSVQRDPAPGDYLLEIQRAALEHDSTVVRSQLRAVNSMRALDRPGELSVYLAYQEAWLLLQVGDTAAATSELDATLGALPALGPYILDYVQDAAFLVRAMMLRSDLAARTGDTRTARRWATAVSELWAGSDAPLQSEVARMRRLSGSTR
jgi:hypothetical protein